MTVGKYKTDIVICLHCSPEDSSVQAGKKATGSWDILLAILNLLWELTTHIHET